MRQFYRDGGHAKSSSPRHSQPCRPRKSLPLSGCRHRSQRSHSHAASTSRRRTAACQIQSRGPSGEDYFLFLAKKRKRSVVWMSRTWQKRGIRISCGRPSNVVFFYAASPPMAPYGPSPIDSDDVRAPPLERDNNLLLSSCVLFYLST